jgi:hypothetical protein
MINYIKVKNLKIRIKSTVKVSDCRPHESGFNNAKVVHQSSVGHLVLLVIYKVTVYICNIMRYSQYMECITCIHTYVNVSTSLRTTACSNYWIIETCLVFRMYTHQLPFVVASSQIYDFFLHISKNMKPDDGCLVQSKHTYFKITIMKCCV